MNNALGEYVNQYRTENNLSLRDFAKLAEISHTHIDSIEKGIDYRTGKPVRITNETIQKLAKALHADESYLFELSIGKTPSPESVAKENSHSNGHGTKYLSLAKCKQVFRLMLYRIFLIMRKYQKTWQRMENILHCKCADLAWNRVCEKVMLLSCDNNQRLKTAKQLLY